MIYALTEKLNPNKIVTRIYEFYQFTGTFIKLVG